MAQANMLANPGVPEVMVTAFERTTGDLSDRLLAALDAAEALGGDFRGMQSAGLIVRTGERGRPAWQTVVADVRVDDHHEPLTELRRLAGLSRAYRRLNASLERLADGDHVGAVKAARELSALLPDDRNARMRLSMTLAAVGDPEGHDILGTLAEQSDKWSAYVLALCDRYHIDPTPILDGR